jgi:hypothetical protein
MKTWLTIGEAGHRLGKNYGEVVHLIKTKHLPTALINGVKCVHYQHVNAMINPPKPKSKNAIPIW